MADASDLDHLEYATNEGRAVVTQDDDFLKIATEWQEQGYNHGGIVLQNRHFEVKVVLAFWRAR